MANILEKYGIKEVADVTFYNIGADGKPASPALFLDTLKVSSPETTSETTDARGGKGNPALITWDYNKEITVTLQDALFSVRSLEVLYGGKAATITPNASATAGANGLIMRMEQIVASTNGNLAANGWSSVLHEAGCTAAKTNAKVYTAEGTYVGTSTATLTKGNAYFVSYDIAPADNFYVLDISANTFPGTYYVVGDTYCRSEATGKDEFFQFIIPKAKVTSESVTLTLEAEGDPTVFDMNLRVLRPADGVMMKLVKYSLTEEGATASTSSIIHNHTLATGA